MATEEAILYLGSEDVRLACEEVDPLAAVRDVLILHAQDRVLLPNEAYLSWSPPGGGEARSINMPAMINAELPAVGTKIINANTANPDRGLPRASGLTILFDVITARPLCIMEAGYLSSLRTAAVSLLGIQYLLIPKATTATLIGAGVLARQHALLIGQRAKQITQLRVFDLQPSRAAKFCAAVGEELEGSSIKLQAAANAEAAVEGSDLIVTCTTTKQSYVKRHWLKAGAVAVNVSLDDLDEDVLLTADRLYVDDWDLIVADQRRLLGRLVSAGRVLGRGEARMPGVQTVTGTLGELILGACEGRSADDEICVVNPFGLAIEDIALAWRVYQVARQRGLGLLVPR